MKWYNFYMRRILASFILFFFAACSGAKKIEPQIAEQQEQQLMQRILEQQKVSQANYKIQAGDLLEIAVFREDDMSRTLRVSGNGTLTYPLAGNIKLGDLTVPLAEKLMAGKLSKFVKRPQVTILIKEYAHKQVYVLGEVKQPGAYSIPNDRPLSALEAITMAGGFAELAAPNRTRVLRNSNGQNQSFKLEVSRITKAGDKTADIILEPNDTVFVPQSFF